MTATRRGSFSRILPWAALGLMVVFFFMQVAARNRAVAEIHDLREQLAGASADPAPAALAPAAGSAELAALGQALAEARDRAEAAATRAAALASEAERAEAVRSTQAARADLLAEQLRTAEEARATLETGLASARAEVAAAIAARDTAQGAGAALALQLEEARAALVTSRAEAAQLRADLREVGAQMERLLAQAVENRARIAALQQRPEPTPTPMQHVRRWAAVARGADADRPAATRVQAARYAEALGALWMEHRSDEDRGAHAVGIARVLALLPPSPEARSTAKELLMEPQLGDARIADLVRQLAPTHLRTGPDLAYVILQGGPQTRAAALSTLRGAADAWSARERALAAGIVRPLLATPAADRRRDGATALGLLAAPRATADLVARLEDDDAAVRHAAAWALTRLPREAATVTPLEAHARRLLDSPDPALRGEGIWLAQWLLGQPQNTDWIQMSDQQIRRVADRLRQRLDD